MAYILGKRSQDRLVGVHPALVAVVEKAITVSEQDFGVLEGLRTMKRQQKLFDGGASRTMNSRHLTGHAVDLGVFIGRELRGEFKLYYKLAETIGRAAQELNISVEWGGCWEVITGKHYPDVVQMVKDYSARCDKAGREPFLDGQHFQLPFRKYPKV